MESIQAGKVGSTEALVKEKPQVLRFLTGRLRQNKRRIEENNSVGPAVGAMPGGNSSPVD